MGSVTGNGRWGAGSCGRCIIIVADVRVKLHLIVMYLQVRRLCASILALCEVACGWFVGGDRVFLHCGYSGGHWGLRIG
jgi:hypothetical protein